jgi:hypothetical protein
MALSQRVMVEMIRCIVLDAERNYRYDGADARENNVLIVDVIRNEIEASGLQIIEIPSEKTAQE